MKKALIVLTALAASVTGLEPAMATTGAAGTVAADTVAGMGDAVASKQYRHGDRRWGHGRRWGRTRRVCTWRGYGHRRVRVCRVVRWR